MENKIKLTERHKTRADKYNYPYFDCEVGDIVYFPIWESQDSPKKIKGRPVLVLKKMGGHAIVAEITKHDRRPNFKGEIVLNRYWDYGLEKLSTLRLNQQADILLNDVVFKIGTLTHDTDTFDYVFEELESLEDEDIDMRMFRDRKEPKVLNNSMKTDNEDKIKKIDDFINDVYKMRGDSIASYGEYGKGNLVFKELRNRGYLDKLRDLKVELETDEMSLTESKADIQKFIDKFGKDNYDKFIKLKDRLKNNKVSVDIVYHTAHTSKEDMNKLLSDIDNKVVKDTDTNSTHMNVVKAFEDDKWLIYDVKDWETAMNLGEGTTWCITGRYKTKEVKPSQAEQYFNEYLEERYSMYLFVMDKSTGQATYCICPIKDYETGEDIWNREDYKVDYAEGVPDFEYNGYKYFDAKTFRVVDGVLTGQAPIDIESYEIPDGVKTIDGCVFENCDKLKSIKFPESVTYIGYRAFNGCKRLNNVVLPSKLEVISSNAFSECKSLTKINLPETLETIVGGAFSGCSLLEEIKLPSLLKNLGDSVFEDCTSLKSIVIPSSVQEICYDAFDGCKNLSSVTLPNGVVYIDDEAFARCNSLTELVLPDSVRQIGKRCFYGCDNLKKIYLPRSVLNVFQYAFRDCSKLTIYCKDDEDALNYWDDDWNPDNRPVVWNCSVEKYLAEDLSTSKLSREENVDGIGFYVATKMTIKDYCNLINVKECESLDELSDELLDKAVEEQITYWDFDLNELKSGAVIPEENGVYVRLGNDTEGYRYYETHLNNDSFEYKKKQQQ